MVILVVGLFLAPASWAEAIAAQNQPPIGPSCVQCYAPANTWCVPATSSAAVPEAVQPAKAPAPAVTRAETPWQVLGSYWRPPSR